MLCCLSKTSDWFNKQQGRKKDRQGWKAGRISRIKMKERNIEEQNKEDKVNSDQSHSHTARQRIRKQKIHRNIEL